MIYNCCPVDCNYYNYRFFVGLSHPSLEPEPAASFRSIPFRTGSTPLILRLLFSFLLLLPTSRVSPLLSTPFLLFLCHVPPPPPRRSNQRPGETRYIRSRCTTKTGLESTTDDASRILLSGVSHRTHPVHAEIRAKGESNFSFGALAPGEYVRRNERVRVRARNYSYPSSEYPSLGATWRVTGSDSSWRKPSIIRPNR